MSNITIDLNSYISDYDYWYGVVEKEIADNKGNIDIIELPSDVTLDIIVTNEDYSGNSSDDGANISYQFYFMRDGDDIFTVSTNNISDISVRWVYNEWKTFKRAVYDRGL